jgi:hypothetical protein
VLLQSTALPPPTTPEVNRAHVTLPVELAGSIVTETGTPLAPARPLQIVIGVLTPLMISV